MNNLEFINSLNLSKYKNIEIAIKGRYNPSNANWNTYVYGIYAVDEDKKQCIGEFKSSLCGGLRFKEECEKLWFTIEFYTNTKYKKVRYEYLKNLYYFD